MSGKIDLVQQSKESSPRGDQKWFFWNVFLRAEPADIDKIISVTYHLHPSFPIKDVKRTNRSEGFAFSTAGWGVFTLRLSVLWRREDGKEIITKHEHYLDFSGKDKVTTFELT